MKISRRIAMVTIAAVLVLPLAGCPSQSETSALIKIVGQSVVTLANIQGNPELATQLKTASDAAAKAVAEWKPGQPADQVTQALNLLTANINLIPVDNQTAVYITLAVTTVNSIIAIVTTHDPAAPVAARSTKSAKAAKAIDAPKTAEAYKAQWNALKATHPSAPVLK